MNKYGKLIGGIVILLVLLGGSVILYNNLSKQYKGSNLISNQKNDSKDESGDEDKESKEDQENPADQDEKEKAIAPNFTVIDQNGQERDLFSFRGKPVIVNFWASWCGPCREEFPDFQNAYDKYGQEIDFVMVNLTDGSRETKGKAEEFISSQKYTFPIYFDEKGEAASTYGIYSIPTSFFIDKEGYIVASAQGMLNAESLQTGIDYIK